MFLEYSCLFKKYNANMECDRRTHAFDQRGWGRSVQKSSQKGLTGPTTTVLNDISSVVESLFATAASMSAPFFLMGHSMGGAEVFQWAARYVFSESIFPLPSLTMSPETCLGSIHSSEVFQGSLYVTPPRPKAQD